MKQVVKELCNSIGIEKANLVMQMCGIECIGSTAIETARKLYKESKDIGDFLTKLNAQHIGGGNLRLDGNSILGGYDRCYCGSVSKTKSQIPLTYCFCSTGWYKKLFEEVLAKPVQVELLQSITNGADKCLFRISL